MAAPFVEEIFAGETYKGLGNTRYVNDKQITDHYAIIPTGQGLSALKQISRDGSRVYQVIVRRFLGIFLSPGYLSEDCTYAENGGGAFFRELQTPALRRVSENGRPLRRKKKEEETAGEAGCDQELAEYLKNLKKGAILSIQGFSIREGETSPPKRYNSGSMILAMENAGQLIEDEELRAQIKGSGIGTSATRAEILKKLVTIKYLALNKKTQIITPTQLGEMIFDVVNHSIRSLLNPELTASWEKGLTYVADGTITPQEYMDKLEHFIRVRTDQVLNLRNQTALRSCYDQAALFYKKGAK